MSRATKEPNTVNSEPKDEFITVREAAGLLRMSEISIRRMLWKKKLTRYKAMGRTLLLESEVRALIHEA